VLGLAAAVSQPAEDPIAVADQKFEEIEHLRFDVQQQRPPAQLAATRIECVIVKEKLQLTTRPYALSSEVYLEFKAFYRPENQDDLKSVSRPPQSQSAASLLSFRRQPS
jgi:hypothetical protein